jgi:hypothetical protein
MTVLKGLHRTHNGNGHVENGVVKTGDPEGLSSW